MHSTVEVPDHDAGFWEKWRTFIGPAILISIGYMDPGKTRIEERIRNVPAANRERAFINAAKTEAQNLTVRPPAVRP